MYPVTLKILIVDDHSTMRKTIREILAEMGYSNTLEAFDGQNAIDILHKHVSTSNPIEFVISDWNMPILNGLELLKHCRGSLELKSVPFMLVTGEREQSQIVDAAKAGVSDYLIKPFSPLKIKEKIEKIYLRTQAGLKTE